MNNYPRVLIINQQSMNKNNATGITMRSLWEGWPVDNLLEIYTDNFEEHVTAAVPFRSICIPTNCLNRIAHGSFAQKVNTQIKDQEIKKQSFKTVLRQAAVLGLDMIPLTIPCNIEQVISEFHPEIIYSLGATVNILDLVCQQSLKYDIPVVIHFMDNWVENLQWTNSLANGFYRRKLDKAMRSCLKRSRVGLAISPQMANAYEKKFDVSFYPIMNCIDVNSFHLDEKELGKPIRFVYAGGLHLNRWKALMDISKAISLSGLNAQLDIFTSEESANRYKNDFPDNTIFHEPVAHEKIKSIYSTADILVHVETNNPLLLGFFKYSISTKIPEYLATGRPMLFYGPKELGLYNYLAENDAAFLCSDYDSLCKALSDITSSSMRLKKTSNALKLAKDNHDSTSARTVLREALCS